MKSLLEFAIKGAIAGGSIQGRLPTGQTVHGSLFLTVPRETISSRLQSIIAVLEEEERLLRAGGSSLNAPPALSWANPYIASAATPQPDNNSAHKVRPHRL